jgi:hypothetical protein
MRSGLDSALSAVAITSTRIFPAEGREPWKLFGNRYGDSVNTRPLWRFPRSHMSWSYGRKQRVQLWMLPSELQRAAKRNYRKGPISGGFVYLCQ